MLIQLYKKPGESKSFILNLSNQLQPNEIISSIDSIITTPNGLSLDNQLIIPSDTQVNGILISAGTGLVLTICGGLTNNEYLITLKVTTNQSNTLTVEAITVVLDDYTNPNYQYYGNTFEGDDFFNSRLNSDDWVFAENGDKRKSLIEATRVIDRLNFVGAKADPNQVLQFPRLPVVDLTLNQVITSEGLTIYPQPTYYLPNPSIPDAIRFATYELAIKLLGGFDIDMEIDSLHYSSFAMSGVRSYQKENWVPEHIQAGILSAKAWYLIRPFLRDPKQLRIKRVS